MDLHRLILNGSLSKLVLSTVPVECRRTANPSRQEPWRYHQVWHEMSAQVGLTCEDANDCHLVEKTIIAILQCWLTSTALPLTVRR